MKQAENIIYHHMWITLRKSIINQIMSEVSLDLYQQVRWKTRDQIPVGLYNQIRYK